MKIISRIQKMPQIAKLFIAGILLSLTFAFLQQTEDWVAPASARQMKNPVPSSEASITSGSQAYEKECLSCHGRKGKGNGPNSFTLEKEPGDLTSSKVQNQTDGELFWKITEGRKPMPSARLTLSDNQRWEVVNYIRTLKTN